MTTCKYGGEHSPKAARSLGDWVNYRDAYRRVIVIVICDKCGELLERREDGLELIYTRSFDP